MSVSIVLPTRNRAFCIAESLETFYLQAAVIEIIVVDDAGNDDTRRVVESAAAHFPGVKTIYLRNDSRRGAAYSRQRGVSAATGEYILFCDDDVFLDLRYVATCVAKLESTGASIVSGRLVYRNRFEDVETAIERFGFGIRDQEPFGRIRFRVRTDARLTQDTWLPFTHAIYLCRREFFNSFAMDPHYSKGNGFREETDVQMRAFTCGHKILITSDAHVVHRHNSEVRSGGQRVGRIQRYFWTVSYTNYFFKKYFDCARPRLGISYGRRMAIALFAIAEFYVFFIRPAFLIPRMISEIRVR